MTSKRKSIRHAIAAALTGNTSAGANVFASRTRSIPASKLPAILVYTSSETAEVFNQSPRELRRTLSVGIEIAARADDDLDDALDDIAEQVERVMSEHQTLSGTASDVLLTGTEITLTKDGDNQHGAAILTYEVTYYTVDVSEGIEGPGVPDENVLRPFERAGAEWRPNGATADSPVTKDLNELPQ